MRVTVRRDHCAAGACGADEGRCLSSWRGAQIEHAVFGLHVEEQRDGLRSFILNGNRTGAEGFGARGASAAYGKRGLKNFAGFDAETGVLERGEDFFALPYVVQCASQPRSAIVRFELGDRLLPAKAREPAL